MVAGVWATQEPGEDTHRKPWLVLSAEKETNEAEPE